MGTGLKEKDEKTSLAKFGQWGSVKSSIIILLFLSIVLNGIIFLSYQGSHPDESLYKHIWEYASSNAFKVLTTSLILPIFLIALESYFNISGVIKERIQSEKQKRIEAKLECVQKTIGMWNDLNNLTSEIVYFKKSDQGAKKGDKQSTKNIETILQRIENFENSAYETVNMWHFRFKNLKPDDTGLFLTFINVLLNSAITIAHRIRVIKDDDKIDEICELQDTLGAIQDGIRAIVYHPIIVILKSSIDILEEDLTEEQELDAKEQIQTMITRLNNGANDIKSRYREHNEFFSYIEEDEVKDVRAKLKAYEEWRIKNPKKQPNDWTHMADLEKLFWSITHEKICGARKIPYSLEYIRNLADWFAFQEVIQMIDDRT